jgi:hypothetical protein
MNKFKVWLINKLKMYLEIDILEEKLNTGVNEIENAKFNINTDIKNIDDRIDLIYKDVCNNKDDINTIHTTIENVVHIGTDVRQYRGEHSWAVVCIEGNMNIVKFVDLNGRYARDILDFLKQFEAGRHCIDTPNSPIFYSELFKF